jgi:hypothetical protein
VPLHCWAYPPPLLLVLLLLLVVVLIACLAPCRMLLPGQQQRLHSCHLPIC